MNSGSYYETTTRCLRFHGLDRRHDCAADRGAVSATSGQLDGNSRSVHGKLSGHGFLRTSAMPRAALASRGVARGCGDSLAAHLPTGSIFECVLSGSIPEYGSRRGRCLWGMDALVLCWRFVGSNHPPVSTIVRMRPNLLADEDLPPGPHQKRSINKRARLKAAGLTLFGEKGYEATSITEIARRAKHAVGSFYQHF